jgi:hypothetical protein
MSYYIIEMGPQYTLSCSPEGITIKLDEKFNEKKHLGKLFDLVRDEAEYLLGFYLRRPPIKPRIFVNHSDKEMVALIGTKIVEYLNGLAKEEESMFHYNEGLYKFVLA